MSRKNFTPELLLARWEDRREVLNLMGKYSAHFLIKLEKDIYDTFWTKSHEDISLGVNNGYYTGAEAVKGYYGALHQANILRSRLIQKAFPDKLGHLSSEEVYGVGMLDYKPLDTPVVQVASDGKTAKGIWCCRGSYSDLSEGGPVSYWEWSCFAVDFIREDDGWKIWHMLYLQDVNSPCGTGWADKFEGYPPVEAFALMKDFEMPEPNEPVTLREIYHPMRHFSPPPDFPEPYDTFSETFSYGMRERRGDGKL